MFSVFDRLRRQPVATRRHAAVVVTVVVLGLIVVMWLVLSSLRTRVVSSGDSSPRTINGIVAPY